MLYVYDKGCLDLTVSPKNLDRALRIFDATIKTCEKKGYEVSVSNSMREHKTIVKVLGEHLEIVLRETYFEKTNSVNQNKSSVYNRREYAPSGYLSLTIRNERHTRHKSWNDGKRRLIEDCLDDFLEGLLYMAEQEKEEREKRKKEEEERRERTRQYQEAAKARQEEEARLTALRSEAANWHESQQIRAYVSAVREKTLQNEGEIDPDSDLARWLLWANEQADRIDPLADNPDPYLT